LAKTLPKSIQRLARYADTLITFASNPARFIRKRVLSFIVGVVAALANATGAIGRDALGSVETAWRDASEPIRESIGGVVYPIIDGWIALNVGIANIATDVLGPLAPIAVVAVVVVQLALFIRAIPPALVAASDALGAVPVIGSLLDALASFAIKYIEGNDL